MVYVLSTTGQPLMPTRRYGKVRHLLKEGKAVVVKRCPFTIRLLYDTLDRTQPVSLGVDAGSVHVGLSACEKKRELLSAEVELRTDVSNNITQRRTLRRSRRNRKTKYRKPRFQNRVHTKKKGWLAPSVMTFGYITAKQREKYSLEKSHRNDARCIAVCGGAEPASEWYYVKKVRCHNRQIHKLTIQPGGERKRNQSAYQVKGFRLFDQVRFAGQECFIFGRRATGYFDLQKADGTKVHPCASYKKLELIHKASHVLVERRSA